MLDGTLHALPSGMTAPPEDFCPSPAAAPPKRTVGSDRATFAASAGSILSAFLASACCVGPLIFALLGLGGAGLLVKFEPYRPYFMAITFALLGTGFYFTYRRPRTSASAASGFHTSWSGSAGARS